ncbi:MAG: cell division protein ZipA C-terminal FtsZ-binding domain-containing protein [Burkholderiaceae bacterium]
MTDLQISLIAIGGTIVVGVISYNKWQEYKTRKNVERAFSNDHDDVLMQPSAATDGASNTRHEPGFSMPADAAAVTDAAVGTIPAEAQMPLPAQDLPVDPLIDCNIPLMLEGVVHGEQIMPALQTLTHIGSKPIHFIGLRQDQIWEAVRSGGIYSALQAGVQLANRSSALNELEYSDLVMRLRAVADTLGAEPDVPDMTEVVDIAGELHRFIVEHDAQLGINVQSNGAPWALHSLHAILEKQGFALRADGRFCMPDGDGGNLFLLSTNATPGAATTARLTLLLEVPCVAPLRDGFGAMTACAKLLASKLGGSVVDDGSQILTEQALADIAAQVAAFYDDMETAEIPAGSNRAQRLFH